MPVSRKKVTDLQSTESRTPLYEVSYGKKTVTYHKIDQIDFDRADRIVLVYPEGSGKRIRVDDGKYTTSDRRVVR